ADGAVYDIYASQDAFELKPNLDNTIALDLQSQQVPGGAQNCTALTTPVLTPEGAVQYNAPAATPAPATPAPSVAPTAPRVTPPAPVVVPQSEPTAPAPVEPAVPAPTAPVEPATPPATPPG
ncbi:MAG: hypothetical protein Q8R82_08175, partial [Hyphomonadaceae bacterium]|nr:hypothetical protein [Hyphomonadaceae bacterium]